VGDVLPRGSKRVEPVAALPVVRGLSCFIFCAMTTHLCTCFEILNPARI